MILNGYKPFKSTDSSKQKTNSEKITTDIGVSDSIESSLEIDHRLLLKSSLNLLRSRNSGVVISTVTLLWMCGRRSSTAMSKVRIRIELVETFIKNIDCKCTIATVTW